MLVSLLKFSRHWQRSPSNVWRELLVQISLWRPCNFSLLGLLLQLWAVPLAVSWYIAGPAELQAEAVFICQSSWKLPANSSVFVLLPHPYLPQGPWVVQNEEKV